MIDEPWSLWVDDQGCDPLTPDKHPPDYEWIKFAISAPDAILLIKEFGCPCFIDLDDDLGDGRVASVKSIVKHLYEKYPTVEIGYRIRYPSSEVGNWLYTYMYSWHQTKGFGNENSR